MAISGPFTHLFRGECVPSRQLDEQRRDKKKSEKIKEEGGRWKRLRCRRWAFLARYVTHSKQSNYLASL